MILLSDLTIEVYLNRAVVKITHDENDAVLLCMSN